MPIPASSSAPWPRAAQPADSPAPAPLLSRLFRSAGFDFVIVETVGVGQDEIDIAALADVTVVVLVPGMGDDIQAIKAGMMEIADIFVINKADRPGVEQTQREIEAMLSLGTVHRADHIRTIAIDGTGVPELLDDLETRQRKLTRSTNSALGDRSPRHRGAFARRSAAVLYRAPGPAGSRPRNRGAREGERRHAARRRSRASSFSNRSIPTSTIAKFLEKRGPGLHHVAMRVPDLHATIRRLESGGIRLLGKPQRGAGGHLYVFVHPASTGGVLWELIQDQGAYLTSRIGIIGGSGLYSMPGFHAEKEVSITTPFGAPSDNYIVGELEGHEVAFLSRHGRGHRLSPSELNFRANIYGMKTLGVDRILSLSAVGSLKEEHRPLDFVIPDQFFDRTRGRISTFFGDGLVAHVSFADPVCPQLSDTAEAACRAVGVNVKRGGTYICMEGPAFSTKAESNLYRSWNMDVIGMTNLQEAKLAREAEICYVTIAMVTDYDCWHADHDAVEVTDIIRVLQQNAANACQVIADAVKTMPAERTCKCGSALAARADHR